MPTIGKDSSLNIYQIVESQADQDAAIGSLLTLLGEMPRTFAHVGRCDGAEVEQYFDFLAAGEASKRALEVIANGDARG